MKRLNAYRIRLMVVGSVIGVVLGVEHAEADFTFGVPTEVPNVNSSSIDACVAVSPDGLGLYFMSNRPYGGNPDYCDLWVATRVTMDDEWGTPVNLGPPINSSAYEGDPSLSADGLELYFNGALPVMSGTAQRPDGYGGSDLWVARRATIDDEWGIPLNLGPIINTSAFEGDASLTADGLQMFFGSDRTGGYGDLDLYVTTRVTTSDPWGPPVNLGSTINTADWDSDPQISPDGLVLLFSSYGHEGHGTNDLWMTRRATRNDSWSSPVNLGPIVNTPNEEADPSLTSDGAILYFGRGLAGFVRTWDLWQVEIHPIVDFNGDGKVNGTEIRRMADQWGRNDPLCDMGPTPFGDGIVAVEDLIVLAGHIGQELYDPTLLAHWALDETEGMVAADSAGESNGTVMGVPAWQPEGGRVDGALEFDGLNDFVLAGVPAGLGNGPFSVLAWVKGGTPGQAILSAQGGARWLYTNPIDGSLMTDLSKSGRVTTPLFSEAVVIDGRWHRITLVWDGTDRILYADEQEVARDAQPEPNVSAANLLIGCGGTMTASTFWSGLIDDVRIYNRAVAP